MQSLLQYLCVSLFFMALLPVSAQGLTDEKFNNSLKQIMQEAASGFQQSKGELASTEWSSKYYTTNLSFFNSDLSRVVYRKEEYFQHANETVPEAFYFFQKSSVTTPEGSFISQNAERLFDAEAAKSGLTKKTEKLDREVRKTAKSLIYVDKRGQKVLQIYLENNKTVSLYVYSDLRPTDLPKYVGCLILYKMQDDKVVGAMALYLYGDGFNGEANLYANAISHMGPGREHYTYYEWLPSGRESEISSRVSPYGAYGTYHRINADGFFYN